MAIHGLCGRRVRPRIVGWRVSPIKTPDFVLNPLEQALYARQPAEADGLVNHADRGSQYVSIRYTERLTEAGIEPSVGSRGDSYANGLAETINGLYKVKLIHLRGAWEARGSVDLATLEWMSWFNHPRMMEQLGYEFRRQSLKPTNTSNSGSGRHAGLTLTTPPP